MQAVSNPIPGTSEAELREQLYLTLARECQGRILVFGHHGDWFRSRIRRRRVEAEIAVLENLPSTGELFDTVVLVGYMENTTDGAEIEAIDLALSYLAPDGRLICCVPNEDFNPFEETKQNFDEENLVQLLKSKGKVRPLVSQPFIWLVMRVTKLRRPSKSMLRRYEIIADLCRGKVLDLGCGAGHGAAAVAANGHELQGFDINQSKLRTALKLYPNLNLQHGDILHLPEDLGEFDTVLLAEVLEHVDPQTGEQFLAHAWKHVGVGGRLLISVPNRNHVPHQNHLVEFTWKSLMELLKAFGEPQVVASQPYKWLLMYVVR